MDATCQLVPSWTKVWQIRKRVVLRRSTGESSRENDRNEDLHDVVGDHGCMELRHVGFEMPRAFVVFP